MELFPAKPLAFSDPGSAIGYSLEDSLEYVDWRGCWPLVGDDGIVIGVFCGDDSLVGKPSKERMNPRPVFDTAQGCYHYADSPRGQAVIAEWAKQHGCPPGDRGITARRYLAEKQMERIEAILRDRGEPPLGQGPGDAPV